MGASIWRAMLETVPWWKLEPDIDNRLLRSGYGTGQERPVAARFSDGSLAIIYLPTVRDLTIDFAELSGQAVRARWYDPGNGQYLDVDSSPLDKTLHKLRP